ncbi:MAG: dienelactone hydrolase family protein [Desulfovibrionaceae bacterium]
MITRLDIAYRHENTPLEGLFVVDGTQGGQRPAVLLLHEYTGLTPMMQRHADRLARAGYAVLCADMYGAGVRPASADEALAHARPLRGDRRRMRARAAAGLAVLRGLPHVDPARVAAMGFSFGGCAALELARSGADLCAAVSVYGYLNTPLPCAPGGVRCPILALHGAADKVVPMAEVSPFVDEMRTAGADCRLTIFSGAGHGFCNEAQPHSEADGSWYCVKTSETAWRMILAFLAEAGADKAGKDAAGAAVAPSQPS